MSAQLEEKKTSARQKFELWKENLAAKNKAKQEAAEGAS